MFYNVQKINKANRTLLRNLRRARRAAENGSYSSIFSPRSGTTHLSEDSTPSASLDSKTYFQRGPSPQTSSSSPSNTSTDSPTPASSMPGCGARPRSPLSSSGPLGGEHFAAEISGNTQSKPLLKPTHDKLRKHSKSRSCRPDPFTRDYTSLASDPERAVRTLRPTRPLLRGAGADAPQKWVHVLPMTLEEIFHGKTFHFRVVSYTRSGKKLFSPLKVYVPPGSRAGDEIILEGVGNERKNGTRQDVSFIIKELKHPRFRRVRDDLWIDLRLHWADELNNKEGVVYISGVDGQEYTVEVDHHATHHLYGIKTISKAGMPRYDGAARGKLVVRYIHPIFLFVFGYSSKPLGGKSCPLRHGNHSNSKTSSNSKIRTFHFHIGIGVLYKLQLMWNS